MKIIIICIFIVNILFALSVEEKQKIRLEKQIKIQKEKEKKYADERAFYSQKDYDFKGAEINKETLKSIKIIEVDDLDMDSVYD